MNTFSKIASVLAALALALSGCGPEETGDEIEEAAESVEETAEEAVEAVEETADEAVDDGPIDELEDETH